MIRTYSARLMTEVQGSKISLNTNEKKKVDYEYQKGNFFSSMF